MRRFVGVCCGASNCERDERETPGLHPATLGPLLLCCLFVPLLCLPAAALLAPAPPPRRPHLAPACPPWPPSLQACSSSASRHCRRRRPSAWPPAAAPTAAAAAAAPSPGSAAPGCGEGRAAWDSVAHHDTASDPKTQLPPPTSSTTWVAVVGHRQQSSGRNTQVAQRRAPREGWGFRAARTSAASGLPPSTRPLSCRPTRYRRCCCCCTRNRSRSPIRRCCCCGGVQGESGCGNVRRGSASG